MLNPKIIPRQMESFIKRETGLYVKPEKLVTKYSTYSSFYIPCDGPARRSLLDANIWPVGVMLKPYYS